MITDPAIRLLETNLAPIYENASRSRKALPTSFDVAQLSKQINDLQFKLENERQVLCIELHNRAGETGSELETFNQNLDGIDIKLDEAQAKSRELAAFCSQLAVSFTHITDKFDSAASVASKAVMIQCYLRDISIYDSSEDFEVVKDKLKKAHALSFGDPGDENLFDELIERESNNFYYYNYLNNIKASKGLTTKNVNIHRTAEYISRILKIVDITVKQKVAQTAFKNIRKHQSILVMNLLERFNNNKKYDIDELKNISASLFMLGVGEDAINNFIGSSMVFGSEEGVHLMYDDSLLREDTSRILSRYDTFCLFITNDCKNLWPRISEIFDRPQTVKVRYIKKVSGILSTFVSGVLLHYISQKPDEYCTTFHTMYERTEKMIQDISKIDNQEFVAVVSFLDEIFGVHQKGYGAIETKVYSNALNRLLSPTFDKLEKATKPVSFFRKTEDVVNPFSVFSDELLPEFINISKSCICRCALLSSPDQTASNLKKLINIFMAKNFNPLMNSFVKVCSSFIVQNPDDVSNIPKFLKIIMLLNSNILTLEEVYITVLKNILRPYSDVHSLFLRQKDEVIESLEKETVNGLQICIDCASNHSTKLLNSTQKKSDFIAPGDSLPIITDACRKFCQFLKQTLKEIDDYISGENKTSFLTVLGYTLLDCILDHLLLYKYNTTGALNLMMDVTEYQSALGLMDIQEIDEILTELVKVSNIMTVSAGLVESAVQDLTLSKNGLSYAKKLLMLRVDAKEINFMDVFQTSQ